MIRRRERRKVGKWASWVYVIQMAYTNHPVFEEENDISIVAMVLTGVSQ